MMKVSISNIAWEQKFDEEMYLFLKDSGADGIEIAPTRIFPEEPYERIADAKAYRKRMSEQYGLEISSMQSIWFGRNENIFEGEKQRAILTEYTRRAFEFANALHCRNLVFGCPRNRNINSEDDFKIAIEFFSKLGELAEEENTVLALEANPPIYHTNFLNTTREAYEMAANIQKPGIKVNYDLGTVIQNKENVLELGQMLPEVNHVHISEPYLAEIKYGALHEELLHLLKQGGYDGYISIEMKNQGDLNKVKETVRVLLENNI